MVFEVYTDKSGEYRWRLKVENGNTIADSGEGYKNKEDCLSAIESIKNGVDSAIVVPEGWVPVKLNE